MSEEYGKAAPKGAGKCPPCIACGAKLVSLFERVNQPSGGTEFVTFGHYGSTVFDPMDGSKLVINVCDPCLTAAIERGAVARPLLQVSEANGPPKSHIHQG